MGLKPCTVGMNYLAGSLWEASKCEIAQMLFAWFARGMVCAALETIHACSKHQIRGRPGLRRGWQPPARDDGLGVPTILADLLNGYNIDHDFLQKYNLTAFGSTLSMLNSLIHLHLCI